MFEYVYLCWINDLLSSGEGFQDWPSSMHDHMSTPFNVSLAGDWRTAVQAFCFTFTKHFTAYKMTANIFSCSSSILAEQGIEVSNTSVSNGETAQAPTVVTHFIGH